MFYHSLTRYFKSRYPLVRQYDRVDCGPAVLLSILKYYGGDSNLVHIREITQTDVHGSSMLGLVNAARKCGFKAVGARGEYEDLLKEKMPCIAHIQLESGLLHYVVVYKIHKNKVYIGDPGKGKYWLSREKFCDIWKSRSVILLTPERILIHNNQGSWLQWIYQYLFKQKSWIIQSTFLGITYTLFSLSATVFIQLLVDQFIPSKSVSIIFFTGLFLFFLFILKSLVGYIRGKILVVLNKRTNIDITSDFLHHIFSLPKAFFDSRKIGDITARINDSIEIHRAIQLFTQSIFIDGLIILFSLSFIFYFSTFLGTLAIIFIPVYFLVFFLASKLIKREQYHVMENHAVTEASYINSIQGMNTLSSLNQTDFFAKYNISIFNHFQRSIEKLGLLRINLGFKAEILSSTITILFLTFGAYRVIDGSLLIGQFIAAFSLLSNIIPSISNFVSAYLTLEGAYVSIHRMRDLLLIQPEEFSGQVKIPQCQKITLENVSFQYPKGSVLFENLNLEFRKGQIIGLWGPSGIGKTTLIHLLERKYPVSHGTIKMDHVSVQEYDLKYYREKIGIVPQSVHLFNGTLFDNISLGRDKMDGQFIENIIQNLGFMEFLKRFPQGLMTLIGEEGRSLSGGESRIVSILRALCHDPEIIVLDEGFSALDIEWQLSMKGLLKKLAKSKIIIFITHQLELATWTDYGYIISQKGVVTEGISRKIFKQEYLVESNLIHASQISDELILEKENG